MEETKTDYIPHEEVVAQVEKQTSEVQTQFQITQELKKFNLADSAIAALNQKYGGLQVKGIEDKTGYKAVREAWSEVRSKRTGLEKKGLELRNGYQVITKAIIREEKRLVGLLEHLEEKLYESWKRIDEEKERIQQEEQERAERAFISRLEILQQFGMALRDGFYSLGDKIQLDAATIRSLPEDQFLKLRNRAQEIFEAVKAEEERLEAERIRTIEEERRIKEEFIQKQNELYAAQKKLEEERAEMERERLRVEEKIAYEKAERERVATEAKERFISDRMQAAGFHYNYSRKGFEWNNLFFGWDYFLPLTDKQTNQFISDISAQISEAKKKIEEAKKAEAEAGAKKVRAEMKDKDRYDEDMEQLWTDANKIKPQEFSSKLYQNRARRLLLEIQKVIDSSFKQL